MSAPPATTSPSLPAASTRAPSRRPIPILGFSPFELFVARRYLWSRPRQSFIALISLISVCGVIVGVWVLTTTLSAMNGFEHEVQSKIVGANAHVILLTRDPAGIAAYEPVAARLSRLPDVRGVAPMIYSKAMLAAGGRADGVVLKGIDLTREREVTDVARFITPEISGIDAAARSGLPGMVLGFKWPSGSPSGSGTRSS